MLDSDAPEIFRKAFRVEDSFIEVYRKTVHGKVLIEPDGVISSFSAAQCEFFCINREKSFKPEFPVSDQPKAAAKRRAEFSRFACHPALCFFEEGGEPRSPVFKHISKLFCFCGVNWSLVEDDYVFPEIDGEFGIPPEKALAELACLTDEVSLVFCKLLVLAGIVPHDDDRDRVVRRDGIEGAVIYDRRFKGVVGI